MIDGTKNDSDSFIFTLKNPNRVSPSRYMKTDDDNKSITCIASKGPIFGDSAICICENCNTKDNSISNVNSSYEDSGNNNSLFVNTDSSYKTNYFTTFDYEVYCIDNYKDYIYNICQCPTITWPYLFTNEMYDNLLKKLTNETGLLHDLDVIHESNNALRFTIVQSFFKNPSSFLPGTHYIEENYDSILKEWAGDNTMRLAFRASDHGYSGRNFHNYCDNVKGPTLIVIKSSGGWIFGGYTTQSWSGSILLLYANIY